MLTDKQISTVTDSAVDTPTTEYLSSLIDIHAPIDFGKIKDEISQKGPLRLRSASNPYSVEIAILQCVCNHDDCNGDIVHVRRRNGLFVINWFLSPDELGQFDSIDHLEHAALAGHLLDTSAERQLIEQAVRTRFRKSYRDVEPLTCFCEECAGVIGKTELPLQMLASQMASNLTARDIHLEEARQALGEETEDFVSDAFDLGYQLGRLFSEYQVKRDIEEHALAGKSFEQLKAKRAHNAGVVSSGKRLDRMTALLGFMEKLANESAALVRIGPANLAKLACEDAVENNPGLWSQGAGQVDEYLGQIRRGEAGDELKARYLALFPAKPLKRDRKGYQSA